MTTRNTQPVTAESLRRDAERRARQRVEYADELEAAADYLEQHQDGLRAAIRHLRAEAGSWRR